MPSVFTLSGSGRRKKRRKRGRGLSGSSCPTGKVSLRKLRLDRGGYDENGRYWGANIHSIGDVYEASGDDSTEHVRAQSRKDAKAKLVARCPTIRFRR